MSQDPNVQHGYHLACKAREGAYAPYSNFLVGASLKLKNSETYFAGSNVENASYGGTVCAERTAIWKAVTETGGKAEVEWMVLVTDTTPASTPCGICLQVMSEFLDPDTPIHLANLDGIERALPFKDFLPNAFKF
jgi:cytidine deaminase